MSGNIRLGFSGCRNFNDYATFCEIMDKIFKEIFESSTKIKFPIELNVGDATGVDAMVEDYFDERLNSEQFKLTIHYADWDEHGKSAGPRRNAEIIRNSSVLYAFWDKESAGTNNAIKLGLKAKKRVHIKLIQTGEERYYSKRQKLKMSREEYEQKLKSDRHGEKS